MATTHTDAESRTPPMTASDEATESQLEMARAQGDALARALREMADRVAEEGGEEHVGDYLIAYAVEKAEGLWALENGTLAMHEPKEENCHIEVCVRDAADGRFIPELDVRLTVLDADGREIGTHRQEFLWHPWLYHYGRNWKVPGDGMYTLRVRVEAPSFKRHDRKNGKRYAEPVTVEFRGVRIRTGRK